MTTEIVLQYLLPLLIVVAAYFFRGVTGFGSGLIAVPLLAFISPLQIVVPMVFTLDFIASFVLGTASTKQVNWSEIRRLLLFGIIGASFGVFALIRFPSILVLVALGLFVVYFGLRNVFGVQSQGHISSLWAVPAGLVGSTAGALFGTSGPPYIIYLTHRLQDKTAVRATFSWLFVIDGGIRLVLFAASGLLLGQETLTAITLGLLPMVAGLYLGNRTHLNIPREAMLRHVGGLLTVSGASLVGKAML